MDYLSSNLALWNARVQAHIDSEFYDNQSFLKGRNSLNAIELNLLGDVQGKSIVHLQCHFGQDSLSLARMGAEVTGVDFSDQAITKAIEYNQRLDLNAKFMCHDVLTLPEVYTIKHDIVFATYGVIGWHPDINAWTKAVAHCLKPGGKLVFVEFHPMVWMFDREMQKIEHSYFNHQPIIEQISASYTDGSLLEQPMTEYGWNYSLSEVFNALKDEGLTIDSFQEYNYSPYPCFENSVKSEKGFQIGGLENKLPLVYSLVAIKKALE